MRTQNPLQRSPLLAFATPLPSTGSGKGRPRAYTAEAITEAFDKFNAAMAKANVRLPDLAAVHLELLRSADKPPLFVAYLACHGAVHGILHHVDPCFVRVDTLPVAQEDEPVEDDPPKNPGGIA